jgi:hypothetical protein
LTSNTGWRRSFDDPIPVPCGRALITLEDAGNYITKLPKAEQGAAEWQAAIEALIRVATSGGANDACADRDAASVSVVTNNSARSPLRKATKKYRIVR